MGAGGRRRNLKRKRTSKHATASSEGVDHEDDLMKRNSRKHELPATKKPTAEEEEAQPAGAGKKKKEKGRRVVRERLSENLILIMMVHSSSVYEIPGERLARLSEEFQADYAKRKARDEEWQAEQQALIDQYLINGYAESVREVTDDEDDDTAKIDGSKSG